MPATIWETPRSRKQSMAHEASSAELEYMVAGESNEQIVRAVLEAEYPVIVPGYRPDDLLHFQGYDLDPLGRDVWIARVKYGSRPPRERGRTTRTWDTTGGTQHVTQSRENRDRFESPTVVGGAPDFGGLIGVNGDTVAGCDLVISQFSFSETVIKTADEVTRAYERTVEDLTGTVNDAPFRGRETGEVLFEGAIANQRSEEEWEITYKFRVSRNAGTGIGRDLFVGDIAITYKGGWEYLWARYVDAVDSDALVKQPCGAYTEVVYESKDFSSLEIGVD